MKEDRYEIRLSGSGGQGIILAGIILAEAACIFDGREAVQTQSYGPESRGGHSKSEVVISDVEIDYPKVVSPDLLLAMTQDAFDIYRSSVKQGGVVIVDSDLVRHLAEIDGRLIVLPITAVAKDVTGGVLSANIVALGVIAAVSGIVSRESLEKAVAARVPKGTEEMNLAALMAGFDAVERMK